MQRCITSAAFLLMLFATVTAQDASVSPRPYIAVGRDGHAVSRTVFNPKPEYPDSLRKRGIGGQGEFLMHVDRPTGKVTSVEVTKSTGVPALDESCIRAFRQWRFVPNTAAPVIRCPIKFFANAPRNQ
jgi:periplasmic protein TonB